LKNSQFVIWRVSLPDPKFFQKLILPSLEVIRLREDGKEKKKKKLNRRN